MTATLAVFFYDEFLCTKMHNFESKNHPAQVTPRQHWRGFASAASCTISCINCVRVWWGTRARKGGKVAAPVDTARIAPAGR